MEIYLVRHTEVDNPRKLCYGQSDIALHRDYEEHFEQLKTKLGDSLTDAHFISSQFERCTMLAGFLSSGKFDKQPRLAEMNFGHWEQVPWDAIDPEALSKWMKNFVECQVPGGESFEQMQQRCSGLWDELTQGQQSKIILITHAGFIRSVLAHILDIPLQKVFQLQIDYGSVTLVSINNGYPKAEFINR